MFGGYVWIGVMQSILDCVNLHANSCLWQPAIEHVFSNFGVIQTKLRNRLGLSKAAKLVTCYQFLRGKDEIDW